jgi:hypothetical protein
MICRQEPKRKQPKLRKRVRQWHKSAVESPEVVPFKTRAADRWSMVEATMRPVPVVMVKPGKELVVALLRVLIEGGVGPFAKNGLDKSFGFTVGARGVRAGEVMAQAELKHSCVESVGAIASDHCL